MKYHEFADKILYELQEYYGNNAEVSINSILSNNGKRRDALNIRYMENSTIATPAIYLDNFFEMYSNGSEDIDHFVGVIVQTRDELEEDGTLSEIAKELLDWKKVKDFVYPVLISACYNEEALKDFVHMPFHDLASIYEICMEEGIEVAYSKISNTVFRSYGISSTELHNQALSNMAKDGYQMEDLAQLICRYDVGCEKGELQEELRPEVGKMYVITNKRNRHGAACLLYTKFLEEKLGDTTAYIIPSSIHETIFVPVEKDMTAEKLNKIICEVNETQVNVCERLCDHCYLWDGQTKEVKMVVLTKQ